MAKGARVRSKATSRAVLTASAVKTTRAAINPTHSAVKSSRSAAKSSRSATKSSPSPARSATTPSSSRSPAALAIAARRHPLVAEIQRQLAQCGVFDAHQTDEARLVLGVSGGADSIALLLACIAIRDRKSNLPFQPIVGHVHHHLRPSADDDATHVAELCKRFGVECHVLDVHPGQLRGNVSANARMLRYEALAALAKKSGTLHVAAAHHGDDQLETMLIALCRGAGLDGLAGMAWSRPLSCGVSLVRPLLNASKSECEELCRAAGVMWREDPSNVDPQRVRARLRRDVLPHLHELWPDAARRVTSTAEALRAAKALIDLQIEQMFGPADQRQWSRSGLRTLPATVIAAGLRRAALDAAPLAADELNQRHLLMAAQCIRSADRKPREFNWPRRLGLSITSKRIALHAK